MEDLFWVIGPYMYREMGLITLFLAVITFCAFGMFASKLSKEDGIFFLFPALGIVLSLLGGYEGYKMLTYIPPEAQEQTYISEEHKLAAVGNLREQKSSTSTHSGVLTYASTSTVENVETIRFIRQAQDERGTRYSVESRSASEVRIYQADDEAPVERHWHTRTVATDPYTGEEHVFEDRLDFVEIKIPEGSVAHDYEISIEQ